MGGNATEEPKLERKAKTGKTVIFQEKLGQLFQFCPGSIETLFLHVLDLNYPSIYLKCPRKYQKTSNFDIFLHFSKFAPPLPNLGKVLNLI